MKRGMQLAAVMRSVFQIKSKVRRKRPSEMERIRHIS
jgi:hypothetical protein